MGLWDTTNLLTNAYISTDTTVPGDCSLRNDGKTILVGGLDASGTITFNTPPTMSGGLTVSGGTITLPNSSIADSALSSNIAKLNAIQTFTAMNTFSNTVGSDTIKCMKSGGGGYFFIGNNSSIGYYTGSGFNWLIDHYGNTSFNGLTTLNGGLDIVGGIYAATVQTIDFGVNAPEMYGSNITNIPLSAITGISTTYCDLSNNQTISGVKTFTAGMLLSNTVGDNLKVYNNGSTTNYLYIGNNATIGGYNTVGGAYWSITQTGGAEFQSLEALNGLYATNTQIIDFGTNAPTMYGTNISNIPASAFIGYANLVYKNIQNYFTDVQHFEAVVQFENPTVSGALFRAKKNSGLGNAGYILASGNGTLSFYDEVLLKNRWLLEDTGKLTLTGTTTNADMYRLNQTSPSTTGAYLWMNAAGEIGVYPGTGGANRWYITAGGASFFNSGMTISSTLNIGNSLQVGNSIYAPNNGKFTVNFGQNTTSLAPNSVILGFSAGRLLTATASANVVVGSQALAVNTNTQQTVAVGYFALNKHTGTGGNSAIGAYAGQELVSGTGNSFYGSASGIGLRLNCNYNFSMGADTMGACSGVLATNQHYLNADVVGDTFIFFLTPNINVDAFQMMACRGAGNVYLVRVIEADPNNGEIIVSSNVDIDTDSYLYFYNGGTLVVSTTYTGATNTGTTFTIPTGLTGITNLLALVYSYTSTPERKYCGVISYNSTTGVLVVDTTITMVNLSNMKFWTQDFNATKGQNITDCVALGKAALQNIGSYTTQNTAFGSNALNGIGGGVNNTEYLLGSYNCGFGAYAGAGLSGLSTRCVFIGANSDFTGGVSRVCLEGTAIGNTALLNASYTTAIGSNSLAFRERATSIGAYSKTNQNSGNFGTAIGSYAICDGQNSCCIGNAATTDSDYSTCCGGTAQALGLNTSSFGFYSRAISNYACSFGANSTASGLSTTVVGHASTSSGPSSTSIGASSTCSGEKAVSCGANNLISGQYGIGIGSDITVNSTNGIAIGFGSSANHQSSMAFGNGVGTSVINQIVIGKSTHQVDIAGQLRIGAAGSIVMYSGSTLTVKEKYLPYEVYSTLITAATVLSTTSIYGFYRVRSPSTAAISITLPVAAVEYDGMTIVIRRMTGGSAGAWNNNAVSIVNFVGVLQSGLLTTTQTALTLTCLYNGASAYNWNMINLH
jgi:hypothetical protein